MFLKSYELIIEKIIFQQKLSDYYKIFSIVFYELGYTWPSFLMWIRSITYKYYLIPIGYIFEEIGAYTIKPDQWSEALNHYKRNMPRFKL